MNFKEAAAWIETNVPQGQRGTLNGKGALRWFFTWSEACQLIDLGAMELAEMLFSHPIRKPTDTEIKEYLEKNSDEECQMKVIYWVAPHRTDSSCYNIRSLSRREALQQMQLRGISNYYPPQKVEVEYHSGFDLLCQTLGERWFEPGGKD